MFDLLIRQARVEGYEQPVDVAVKDGMIVQIQNKIEGQAGQEIEAKGMFLAPGFVDTHTHLEKALTGEGVEVNSLVEAIATFKKATPK